VEELTTSLLLGRLLATKAYLQKITDPKLSKLYKTNQILQVTPEKIP
jgi:hypothetical protein